MRDPLPFGFAGRPDVAEPATVPTVEVPVELISRCADILNQTAEDRAILDHYDAATIAEIVRTHTDLQDALARV